MSVNIQQSLLQSSLLGTDEGDTVVVTPGSIVMASIDTLGGDDKISAEATGSDSIGISCSAIKSGSGNDMITGTGESDGISYSAINGGSDNDIITGKGSGIDSTGISNSAINGGDGDDIITGIGKSYGISNSAIDGGSGNDEIIATGGIFNSSIKGSSGNDTFNIERGIGSIIGGEDKDLLILEGLKSDYAFMGIDPENLNVYIMQPDTSTYLNVSEVERFQFADNTFAYNDLFWLVCRASSELELRVKGLESKSLNGNLPLYEC